MAGKALEKKWLIQPVWDDASAAASKWSVSPLVAQVLFNRGVGLDGHPRDFLVPALNDLIPPDALPGARRAAGRLAEAVRRRERIVLYGDYDVDGMTGLAILWHLLTRAGADVGFYVPHRLEEGYGVNVEAVRTLIEEGVGLLVTIDCGIGAVEADAIAHEAGVTMIVTDHHQPGTGIPEHALTVHPSIEAGYGNRDLCGSGVAFKLAWALAQELSGSEKVSPEYRAFLRDALPLAALGTIADVVPLVGENRIIARHGLALLPETPFVGLRALIESVGLSKAKLSGDDVGFKLAPRLNAAGRMGHARLAVELLTRADENRAREIALYLDEQNRARQATERRISAKAVEMVTRAGMDGDACRGIVLAHQDWHAGVIGIVAARLVDRFGRPTVLIAVNDGMGQGSARSIRHFDMAQAFAACDEHLEQHGGHAMAAGLKIKADRIEAFTEAFVARANNILTAADLNESLRIDAEVSLSHLDLATAEVLSDLGPFGVGNAHPCFATDWVELADEPRCVGKTGTHLQAVFRENGSLIKAIGFGHGGCIGELKRYRRCRVAFRPLINEFNGHRSVEMQALDFKFPDKP